MDEPRNITLVTTQDFSRLFIGQIGLEMTNHLAGQFIKQVGMIIIRDVIEIDQTTNHIILQPRFFHTTFAQSQGLQFSCT